jgi:hypothetical protein
MVIEKNRREVVVGMTGAQTYLVRYENIEVVERAAKKNQGSA